jgi:DNA-binding transcriptional LysR family regulator
MRTVRRRLPEDLAKHPALFMMQGTAAPEWRLRHARDPSNQVSLPLVSRMASNDMIGLKNAAIAGLGIVALPRCICRADVLSGALRRVLPDWAAG